MRGSLRTIGSDQWQPAGRRQTHSLPFASFGSQVAFQPCPAFPSALASVLLSACARCCLAAGGEGWLLRGEPALPRGLGSYQPALPGGNEL